MKFVYRGQSRKLARAVAYANQLAVNEAFWLDIAAKPVFECCALSGVQVVRRLRQSTSAVTVRLWTPPDAVIHRRTVAITDPARPHHLFYHRTRTGLPVSGMVRTLASAFVHDVDLFGDDAPFLETGHDASSVGAEDTAPCWIGALAQTYYWSTHSAEKSADESLVAEPDDYAEGAVADANIVEDAVQVAC